MMSISVAGPCPRFLLLPFSRARDRTYSLLVISSDENHQFPTFEWLIYKGFYMSAGIRMAKIRDEVQGISSPLEASPNTRVLYIMLNSLSRNDCLMIC
ncbi:uncharacterized protein LOC144576679 isoform X3 [Callithrix jacchus]